MKKEAWNEPMLENILDLRSTSLTIARHRSVGIWPIYGGGWHCSWCFGPEGIRKKLLDAPKSDYPRFGDDVAKTTVDYIKRLIKHGKFILVHCLISLKSAFSAVHSGLHPKVHSAFATEKCISRMTLMDVT